MLETGLPGFLEIEAYDECDSFEIRQQLINPEICFTKMSETSVPCRLTHGMEKDSEQIL